MEPVISATEHNPESLKASRSSSSSANQTGVLRATSSTSSTGAVDARPIDGEPTTREHDEEIREREATELDDVSILSRRATRLSSVGTARQYWADPVLKLWRQQIRVSVPHVDCRDHLANERTYLAYLRTSLALSILGVIVAQLYTIQHAPSPDPVFGYYVLGKPVASILQASALAMSVIGTHRFWSQQNTMVRGKIRASGWEIQLLSVLSFLLLVGLFAIHVAVPIHKATK